jgi:sulfoxide reductase catalytic subunit YedY
MLIRSPKDWEIAESAATPESLYRLTSRRDFLRTLGIGAGVALAARSGFAAAEGFPSKENPAFPASALKPTAFDYITSYNNFYEFGTDKGDPKIYANKGWKTDPWTVEIGGLVNNPLKIDANELVKKMGGIEQRVYRFRCVEAWSMVIPWDGFPLAKLVAMAEPKPEAKFVKFTSFNDPKSAPGQAEGNLDYPYVEGLRLDEANNELAFMATGLYGKPLPNQNGAPLRLMAPWKYGFKNGKSIVKIEFVAKQPRNTWNILAANEYGFYGNVNPNVDHPRWSQASERVIGGGFTGGRQKTLMFNGYEKQVAALYQGMDLKKYY